MIVQVDVCSFVLVPREYEPPLIVDSDRVPALQLTFQFLKMIARRDAKIRIAGCIIEQLQFAEYPGFQVGRNPFRTDIAFEEIP